MHDQLTNYLNSNKIINAHQYGFQKHTGTTSAVTDLVSHIKNNLNSKLVTVCVFLDMKKAFDTISKEKLCKKLNQYGIQDKNLNLIRTYLYNRPQKTQIGGTYSEENYATFGVPQGGNIPPTLYITYINDIFDLKITGKLYIYADDTCIVFENPNPEKLQTQINKDLELVERWYTNNLLTINEEKTNYMLFDPNKNKRNIIIKINNKNITKVTQTKYLGITLQDDMKWNIHIDNLIQTNCKKIAILRHIQKFVPKSLKKSLYHALFTSKISYLINVWGNTTERNIDKLQTQQNKVLKALYNLNPRTPSKDIYETLNELNIRQLITHKNLTLIHKKNNNTVKLTLTLTRIEDTHEHNTRGKENFQTHKPNKHKYKDELTTTAITKYNKLNKDIHTLSNDSFRMKSKFLILNNEI